MIFRKVKAFILVAALSFCMCQPVNISEKYNISREVVSVNTKTAAHTGISLLAIQIPKSTCIGYTSTSVNVRSEPSVESNILDTYIFNTEIEYTEYDNEWVSVDYHGQIGYICKKYISGDSCAYIDYDAPETSGYKSFMDYNMITDRSSAQYILQNTEAYTGKFGIRQVDGRYCVAIGSYFTSEIGTWFDLVLMNGTVIPCILADQKDDNDTDSANIVTKHNGCMSEFVIDWGNLNQSAMRDGDISSCTESWNSPVDYVRVYEKED